ncbi:MAG: hypothetical protein HY287_02595 [Planctomycetes bacterium]|nr:hypothetical protein [Planctomycetota bacterium]MBI3833199.1 hypothetical protein [Planctomycetota bacterium]
MPYFDADPPLECACGESVIEIDAQSDPVTQVGLRASYVVSLSVKQLMREIGIKSCHCLWADDWIVRSDSFRGLVRGYHVARVRAKHSVDVSREAKVRQRLLNESH